jgi:hypothetical protein
MPIYVVSYQRRLEFFKMELVKPVDIDPSFTLKTASFISVEGSRKYGLVDTTRARKL